MAGNDVNLLVNIIGRDSGASAVVNELGGSLTNTERKLQQFGSTGGRAFSGLNREMAMFQRHFKYAVAGLGTYEIFNAISRIKDYQNEIAQLNSTLRTTPDELNKFGQAAFDISTRTGQSLDEVFQSMQNIVNTIPNMSRAMRNQLVPAMAEIEAQGARVAGVTPQQFGATVMGAASAFYGRAFLQGTPSDAQKRLERIASEIVETQRRIPNPQGAQQFVSSLPMLIQGGSSAGFSLEQSLALYAVAQRSLVNPRTTAQYVRQLLLRLQRPTRESQPFYRKAGLGGAELTSMSGPELLNKLITYGLSLPGGISSTGASEQDVQDFLRKPSWNRLNISGQAFSFLNQAVGGRIQSAAAMTALIRAVQQIPLEQQAITHATPLSSRFKSMDISLSQATTAFQNITTEVGTNLLPVLDPLAQGLVKMQHGVNIVTGNLNKMDTFINQHTRGIPVVGGRLGGVAEISTLVASALGSRALIRRAGGLGGIFRRIPGLRRLGGAGVVEDALGAERGVATTEAAINALAGKATGTYDAPFWVVIHPLTKSQLPELFNHPNHPFGGGGTGTGVGAGLAGSSLFRRIRGNLGKIRDLRAPTAGEARIAGEAFAPIAAAAATYGLVTQPGDIASKETFGLAGDPNNIRIARASKGFTRVNLGGGFMPQVPTGGLIQQFLQTIHGRQIPVGLQPYFNRFAQQPTLANRQALERAIQHYSANTAQAVTEIGGYKNATSLQRAITGMFRMGPQHQMSISSVDRSKAAQGFVEATLNLVPSQEFKDLLQPQQVKVHIPISELPAPTSRGRTRVPRSRSK